MQLTIGQTYQLSPVPKEERIDGALYLATGRVFRLLGVHMGEAWIKCDELNKTYIVKVDRLRNF